MKQHKQLSHLTVLITRPQHQALSLQQLIESYGGQTVLLPCITIQKPKDSNPLQHALQSLDQFDIAIFTSTNAVDAVGAKWPAHTNRNLMVTTRPSFQRKPESRHVLRTNARSALRIPRSSRGMTRCEQLHLMTVAIGPGTARALSNHQINVDLMPLQHNSEGLLSLPELQLVAGKRIAIFCGDNARPLLKHTLQARGATITEASCYRREKPQMESEDVWNIISAQAINSVVTTSCESLQNLFALIGPKALSWISTRPLLVISERIKTLAIKMGVSKPLLAANATDQAIIEALLRVYTPHS